MIKYKIGGYREKIEAVEIERETDQMVFLPNGNREHKKCSYHQYFDTWEEAHEVLMKQLEGKVASLRLRLNNAEGELGNLKGMKKPA